MGDGARMNGHTAWVGPAFQVVPYEPAHMRAIALQPMQAYLGALMAGGYAEKVRQGGPAWTALVHGVPVCCAGFHEPWDGRAIAWAVLGDPGRHMRAVTRAVASELAACPADRIEAFVKVGFRPGERWAAMLGFTPEARHARFCRGEDYWCFVLLKPTPLCDNRPETARTSTD